MLKIMHRFLVTLHVAGGSTHCSDTASLIQCTRDQVSKLCRPEVPRPIETINLAQLIIRYRTHVTCQQLRM
jgi:hypothetical protein